MSFTEIPRTVVFAHLDALAHCPSATRSTLYPTANETCICFDVKETTITIFYRTWGGTSREHTLRTVMATKASGEWRVNADMKQPAAKAPKPARIAASGPTPVAPHSFTIKESSGNTLALANVLAAARLGGASECDIAKVEKMYRHA